MFRNQIVWHKNQGKNMTKQCMQTHDIILFYSIYGIFNIQREDYKTKGGTYTYHKNKYGIEAAEERYKLGKEVQDVWMLGLSTNTNKKYPTQKPAKLLRRIISLSTV